MTGSHDTRIEVQVAVMEVMTGASSEAEKWVVLRKKTRGNNTLSHYENYIHLLNTRTVVFLSSSLPSPLLTAQV